ncbi:MAG TPA: hypothetical protein VFQ44_25515 [Streptosporangiaceae bacterium]|nr:hypothetical protein [Streptosporangiaceae bacterium]
MAATARSGRVGAGAVFVIAAIVVALAIGRSKQATPAPDIGTGCLVHGAKFDVPLTTGQAGIAATIAGVARLRSMPVRAVTIAYAAALQESDLENLPYGDRDSVGVFQQRPSQGWGTRAELLNPVYASTRFFAALAAIPHYESLPVYRAAQAVQHSADGSAYDQYASEGTAMALGFAGGHGRSVWCWYGTGVPGRTRLAAAGRDLANAFGPLRVRRAGDPVAAVRVPSRTAGWAVAVWLMTHAASYHLGTVRFAGYQWTAAHGQRGWRKERPDHHRPAGKLTVAFG